MHLDFYYNTFDFCPQVTWDLNATTVINKTGIGLNPVNFFITKENRMLVTFSDSIELYSFTTRNFSNPNILQTNLTNASGVFSTEPMKIYVSGSNGSSFQVNLLLNGSLPVRVMDLPGECISLFVDIFDDIYCSIPSLNVVVKKISTDEPELFYEIAGNGNDSNNSDSLSKPHGIFILSDQTLYVADSGNDRIQVFMPNRRNASTVFGVGSKINVNLSFPTGISVRSDDICFVIDMNNQRIIMFNNNGYRCVAGCDQSNSLISSKFISPQCLAFDNLKNLYAIDVSNSAMLMFSLESDSCGK